MNEMKLCAYAQCKTVLFGWDALCQLSINRNTNSVRPNRLVPVIRLSSDKVWFLIKRRLYNFANMSFWSSDKTVFFILQYAQHPCLWNKNISEYKSKECRDSAVDTIAQAMGNHPPMNRAEVLRKIRSLRQKYFKECDQIRFRFANQMQEDRERQTVPDWFVAMDCFMQQSMFNGPTGSANMVNVIFA